MWNATGFTEPPAGGGHRAIDSRADYREGAGIPTADAGESPAGASHRGGRAWQAITRPPCGGNVAGGDVRQRWPRSDRGARPRPAGGSILPVPLTPIGESWPSRSRRRLRLWHDAPFPRAESHARTRSRGPACGDRVWNEGRGADFRRDDRRDAARPNAAAVGAGGLNDAATTRVFSGRAAAEGTPSIQRTFAECIALPRRRWPEPAQETARAPTPHAPAQDWGGVRRSLIWSRQPGGAVLDGTGRGVGRLQSIPAPGVTSGRTRSAAHSWRSAASTSPELGHARLYSPSVIPGSSTARPRRGWVCPRVR